MPSRGRARIMYWSTPVISVVGGIAFLIAGWIGGHPGLGLVLLGIMVVFAATLVVAGRRSETVARLMGHDDERIDAIDLRATAAAGLAVIIAVVIGSVVQLAQNRSGMPYIWLGALAGVTYLGAVVVGRLRG